METNDTNKGRIGDIVEIKAVAFLLEQGFEVFRNYSSKGPIDIIAVDQQGSCNLIDVKKATDKQRASVKVSHPKKTTRQVELGVVFLYYCEISDTFHWDTQSIYANLGRAKATADTRIAAITSDGLTLVQACKKYDAKSRTVREYMRRNPNVSMDDAIEHAVKNTKRVWFRGKQYNDKKEWCRAHDVAPHKLEYWLYEKKLPIHQAMEKCFD